MANLVGMSQSTSNIVLIGDQIQLAQPSQGIHPGDSELLAYLIFLETNQLFPMILEFFYLERIDCIQTYVNLFQEKFMRVGLCQKEMRH